MYTLLFLIAPLCTHISFSMPVTPDSTRDINSMSRDSMGSRNSKTWDIRNLIKSTHLSPASFAQRTRHAPAITTINHSFSSTKLDQPQTLSLHATAPSSYTTNSSLIYAKSNVDGCNKQGTPNPLLVSTQWGTMHVADVLQCQKRCMAISQCISYSFQLPLSSEDKNCVFYHMFTSGTAAIIESETSGVFFSDKYPGDGSNFCFSDKPF
jgi:hypothetical protein